MTRAVFGACALGLATGWQIANTGAVAEPLAQEDPCLRAAALRLQGRIEYFNGRSPNGQFLDQKIEYIGIGAHFYH